VVQIRESIELEHDASHGASIPSGQAVLSKYRKTFSGQIPLPKGEGGPKGRVRGAKTRLFTPHPPLRRHPLPSGEGFTKRMTPCEVSVFELINLDSTALPAGAFVQPTKRDNFTSRQESR
jgi:hypothetical protein